LPEITSITSEALQATIRRLLPSQRGFGQDLQATNLIQPIIDLTPTAEGSEARADLQTSLAFGSQTSVSTNNTSNNLVVTPGFFRVFGTSMVYSNSSTNEEAEINVTDGSTTKNLYRHRMLSSPTNFGTVDKFDFIVFLRAGDTLVARASGAGVVVDTTTRQLATVTGTLVNPNGFVFE